MLEVELELRGVPDSSSFRGTLSWREDEVVEATDDGLGLLVRDQYSSRRSLRRKFLERFTCFFGFITASRQASPFVLAPPSSPTPETPM